MEYNVQIMMRSLFSVNFGPMLIDDLVVGGQERTKGAFPAADDNNTSEINNSSVNLNLRSGITSDA